MSNFPSTEEMKQATRIFNEKATNLLSQLEEIEHTLAMRAVANIPRDLDSLEHLVIEHKELEQRLQSLEPEVEQLQNTFRAIPKKSQSMQTKMDTIINKWTTLWSSSHLYIERMKCVEIVLTGLDEATTIVSEYELKLTAFREMPSDLDALQSVSTNFHLKFKLIK
jgi:dystonin